MATDLSFGKNKKQKLDPFVIWADKDNKNKSLGPHRLPEAGKKRRIHLIKDKDYFKCENAFSAEAKAFAREIEISFLPSLKSPCILFEGEEIETLLHSQNSAKEKKVAAHLFMAECHRSGLFGFEENPQKTLDHLHQNARLHDPHTLFLLSHLYRYSDPTCGIDLPYYLLYKTHIFAAAEESAEANWFLYRELCSGEGKRILGLPDPDKSLAKKYFWRAVKFDAPDALNAAAAKYGSDKGCPELGIYPDVEKHREYHERAIAKKQKDALWRDCQFHWKGCPTLGIEANAENYKASFWKAVDAEHPEACSIAYRGCVRPYGNLEIGVAKQDLLKAKYCMEKGIKAKQPDLLWIMAHKYRQPGEHDHLYGITESDPEKEHLYIEAAAESGHAEAQRCMMRESITGYALLYWQKKIMENKKRNFYCEKFAELKHFITHPDLHIPVPEKMPHLKYVI